MKKYQGYDGTGVSTNLCVCNYPWFLDIVNIRYCFYLIKPENVQLKNMLLKRIFLRVQRYSVLLFNPCHKSW